MEVGRLVTQPRRGGLPPHLGPVRSKRGLKTVEVDQAELELRAAIRGQKAAVAGEGSDAFHQGTEKFRAAMKCDLQGFAERVGKQMILDHLHGHFCERHGVLVIAAMVARDVEHADEIAVRIENRHAGAGQEPVGGEIVLLAVHDGCAALGERCADCIGALPVFRPVRAGP